jgi:hypothetical protein
MSHHPVDRKIKGGFVIKESDYMNRRYLHIYGLNLEPKSRENRMTFLQPCNRTANWSCLAVWMEFKIRKVTKWH